MCWVLVGEQLSSSVLSAKVAYLPMEHHSCKNIAQPQEQKLPELRFFFPCVMKHIFDMFLQRSLKDVKGVSRCFDVFRIVHGRF